MASVGAEQPRPLTAAPVVSVPVPPVHPMNEVPVVPVQNTVCGPFELVTRITPPEPGKVAAEATLMMPCGSVWPLEPAAMVVEERSTQLPLQHCESTVQ